MLADQVRVLGAEHPLTLKSRHSLAVALAEVGGSATTARRQLLAVLSARERLLGNDHHDTRETREALSSLDEH